MMVVTCIVVTYDEFWRCPTKLLADGNPQVNNQAFVKKTMACLSAIGLFKTLARFFIISRLDILFFI